MKPYSLFAFVDVHPREGLSGLPRLLAALGMASVCVGAAETTQPLSEPNLPLATSKWSAQETEIWRKLLLGEEADLNTISGRGLNVDAKVSTGWDASPNRVLQPKFLETILLHQPFKSQLTRNGVRIAHALFRDTVDLSHAAIDSLVVIRGCRFEGGFRANNVRASKTFEITKSFFGGPVQFYGAECEFNLNLYDNAFATHLYLQGLKTGHELGLNDARINGDLIMNWSDIGSRLLLDRLQCDRFDGAQIRVGQSIALNEARIIKSFSLAGAEILGSLNLRNCDFSSSADFNNMRVARNVFMTNCEFQGEVTFNGAAIDRGLRFEACTFRNSLDLVDAVSTHQLAFHSVTNLGPIDLRGIQAGRSVIIRHLQTYTNVDLGDVKVANRLSIEDSIITGQLNVHGARIGESLFIIRTAITDKMTLTHMTVGGSATLSPTPSPTVTLQGSRIEGPLILATNERLAGKTPDRHPKWASNTVLSLRDVKARSLNIEDLSQPAHLELDGLEYSYAECFTRTNVEASVNWLRRQRMYSPQPYEQMARVWTEVGQREEARRIRYHSADQATQRMQGFSKVVWSIYGASVGYGFRLSRAFWAALGFWLMGTLLILRRRALPAQAGNGQRPISTEAIGKPGLRSAQSSVTKGSFVLRLWASIKSSLRRFIRTLHDTRIRWRSSGPKDLVRQFGQRLRGTTNLMRTIWQSLWATRLLYSALYSLNLLIPAVHFMDEDEAKKVKANLGPYGCIHELAGWGLLTVLLLPWLEHLLSSRL
jgi:hypothetical protein